MTDQHAAIAARGHSTTTSSINTSQRMTGVDVKRMSEMAVVMRWSMMLSCGGGELVLGGRRLRHHYG